MFYVYIIQSTIDKSFYKGFSLNPFQRLQQHNNKESHYTSNKIPWILVYIEIFNSKTDALVREKILKKYSNIQIQNLINSYKNKLNDYLSSVD